MSAIRPESVLEHFALENSGAVSIERIDAGHINETYRIRTGTRNGDGSAFVLQRLNSRVFSNPLAMMENFERVTAHLEREGLPGPRPLRTKDGEVMHRDAGEECWRVYRFIEGVCKQTVDSPEQARQCGLAYGRFADVMARLPPPRLQVTIPDFHSTQKRFGQLVAAVEADPENRAATAKPEIDAAMAGQRYAGVLESDILPERVAHNDAKAGNVVLDEEGNAICVIDLDTVMPGSVLFDFGDLVRSAAATASEEERDLERVGVSRDLFEALTQGFLAGCGGTLVPVEKEGLCCAGTVIAYEQALRFLADYLLGDPYYKTDRPPHNLDRARNQLRLVEGLAEEEGHLRRVVAATLSRPMSDVRRSGE